MGRAYYFNKDLRNLIINQIKWNELGSPPSAKQLFRHTVFISTYKYQNAYLKAISMSQNQPWAKLWYFWFHDYHTWWVVLWRSLEWCVKVIFVFLYIWIWEFDQNEKYFTFIVLSDLYTTMMPHTLSKHMSNSCNIFCMMMLLLECSSASWHDTLWLRTKVKKKSLIGINLTDDQPSDFSFQFQKAWKTGR